jgi:hypothetical protein
VPSYVVTEWACSGCPDSHDPVAFENHVPIRPPFGWVPTQRGFAVFDCPCGGTLVALDAGVCELAFTGPASVEPPWRVPSTAEVLEAAQASATWNLADPRRNEHAPPAAHTARAPSR